ncbi:PAS domain-containing sensor histidine kinase [Clostridium zeae]|uniref:histidine kinase n=1 Tax=Clostridium zeae TaxID=2759022 RepID=A0ABQ1E7V6_9CLOT|nr:ATP-binding protein [Clostridium zeae]GFZ30756.1 PAS domain-containing sensor histidine kinase [Clostridium zeae]
MKTIKGKLTVVYIALILIILVVGAVSVFNVYTLGKSIDGLITDNYKSIDAVDKMRRAIDAQDRGILKYLQGEKEDAVELFYENNDQFNKWYYFEEYNITENGEEDAVKKVNTKYVQFNKMLSELQEKDNVAANDFYKKDITPTLNELKTDLDALSELNEKAMFDKKQLTSSSAEHSIYIIFIVSITAAAVGLFLSVIFTNKFIRPIYLLINAVKSVKEGEVNKQAAIVYDDEIGLLAREFNNMTYRLYEFEKSTKGTLLAEKNRSTSIIKSISDPLMVLDASFKIKFVNDACESFFGIDEENIFNKHFLQVVKRVDLYDYVFKIVSEGSEDEGEIIDIKRNNKTYFFNVTTRPIKDKDLKIDGVIVLFKNVTELKQLEMLKTDFIGTVSHELKTPLTSIMMGVGLLKNNKVGSLNEKQLRIIETFQEDVEKLNELVSNLLKISKLETDRAVFDIEPCNILDVINKSIDGYTELLQEKRLSVYYELSENLPNVMADQEKVTWVLNNIISNAIRYTEKGYITIGAYSDESKIYIYVKDTGRGIPFEYLEKIFEKFVRVEGVQIMPESTGLGLSIAKEIVEAHGGEIWCESNVNEGSKFIFTLPIESRENE